MTITAESNEPCWELVDRDGQSFEWGDGVPHFPTADAAVKRAVEINTMRQEDADEGEVVKPLRLKAHRVQDAPCLMAVCDGCGYRFDEDEWPVHFTERAEAEQTLRDSEWVEIDGEWICQGCACERVGHDMQPTWADKSVVRCRRCWERAA